MRKWFFYGLLLLILLPSCSLKKRPLKKADKKFDVGEYEVAIELYHKAIRKGESPGEANFLIGESYRVSNRLKEALPYYEASIKNRYKEEEVYFYLAFSYKAHERYDEARDALNNYLDVGVNESLRQMAEKELRNLNLVEEMLSVKNYYRVKNLRDINTPAAEYSPIYNNGELYFTSARAGGKIYKATGSTFTSIYKIKSQGARVDMATLQPLGEMINHENTNEGSVTFSSDGKTMIYAKGNSGKKKSGKDVDLYITRFRRGKWSEPRLIRINDPDAWDSCPSLSLDGRTLYFASNREGGFGGTDLYSATRDGRGRWGNIRNLGPVINTSTNEMFPYAAIDGSMYFCSSGHPGYGGLDLFRASRELGQLKVKNLGSPINSSADDFGLYLFSPTKGFFSSNRDGGEGDDDIYTFVNNDPDLKIINYFLTGTTITNDDQGNETILSGTVVKLYDETNQLLSEAVTGREGEFTFRVYGDENYYIVGEKIQYLTTRVPFTTKGKSIPPEELTKLITNETFEIKVPLDQIIIQKAIVLENIYYDLDKWYIRPDAALELDKLVTILEDNPEIRIELSSHTDSRATADYNLTLSKDRATAAVEYIISKGIDSKRIEAKGYGESQLIISDERIFLLGSEGEQEAAHQINRRTEFKIIEYNQREEEEGELLEEDEINWEENTEDWEKEINWDG
ncbi:OmpA family protein [Bacteroidota bacterium]